MGVREGWRKSRTSREVGRKEGEVGVKEGEEGWVGREGPSDGMKAHQKNPRRS